MCGLMLFAFHAVPFWAGVHRRRWVWLGAMTLWVALYVSADLKTPETNDTRGIATILAVIGAATISIAYGLGRIAALDAVASALKKGVS